jgi:hypothetical protein
MTNAPDTRLLAAERTKALEERRQANAQHETAQRRAKQATLNSQNAERARAILAAIERHNPSAEALAKYLANERKGVRRIVEKHPAGQRLPDTRLPDSRQSIEAAALEEIRAKAPDAVAHALAILEAVAPARRHEVAAIIAQSLQAAA